MCRSEQLRHVASLARFREEAAPHFARIRRAHQELLEAAGAIDTLYAESLAATEELRAEHADCPEVVPLGPQHVLLGLLDSCPAGALAESLHAWLPIVMAAGLSRACDSHLMQWARAVGEVEVPPGDAETLRIIRETRTGYELGPILAALRAQRTPPPDAERSVS